MASSIGGTLMNVKRKIRSFSAALLLVAIFASFSSFSVVAFAADDDDDDWSATNFITKIGKMITGTDEDNAKQAVNRIIKAREGFADQVEKIIDLLGKPLNGWAGSKPYDFAMQIAGVLKAAGSVLIVIFFGIGMFRTSYSLAEHKNFGTIAKSLLRLGVASAFVAKGTDVALQMFQVGTGLVKGVGKVNVTANAATKAQLESAVGNHKITMFRHPVLTTYITMTELAVYIAMIMISVFVVMRFFKFLIYVAMSPMPFAALAGEGTEQFAFAFLKTLAGIALEALVIVLALRFWQVLESSAFFDTQLLSSVPFEGGDEDWQVAFKQYCITTLLSCAAGVSTVMGADRIVSKAFGT